MDEKQYVERDAVIELLRQTARHELDCIDTDNAVAAARFKERARCCYRVAKEVANIQSADVRPVVRGKWIVNRYGDTVCSVCQRDPDELRVDTAQDWGHWELYPPFCPNCGTDMRSGVA